MAEAPKTRRSTWIETRAARHHPARSLSRARQIGRTGALRPVQRGGRSRLRCGRRRLCAARRLAALEPGSTFRIRHLYRKLYDAAIAIPCRRMTGDDTGPRHFTASVSGGAFFGESMFHRVRDASKIALVHLGGAAGGRPLPAARHAVRHRTSAHFRSHRGVAAGLSQVTRRGACRRRRFRRAAARSPGFRQWPRARTALANGNRLSRR